MDKKNSERPNQYKKEILNGGNEKTIKMELSKIKE